MIILKLYAVKGEVKAHLKNQLSYAICDTFT